MALSFKEVLSEAPTPYLKHPNSIWATADRPDLPFEASPSRSPTPVIVLTDYQGRIALKRGKDNELNPIQISREMAEREFEGLQFVDTIQERWALVEIHLAYLDPKQRHQIQRSRGMSWYDLRSMDRAERYGFKVSSLARRVAQSIRDSRQ